MNEAKRLTPEERLHKEAQAYAKSKQFDPGSVPYWWLVEAYKAGAKRSKKGDNRR